jgi:hypothetical protein
MIIAKLPSQLQNYHHDCKTALLIAKPIEMYNTNPIIICDVNSQNTNYQVQHKPYYNM